MRKLLIILIATAITALNVRSYGDITDKQRKKAIAIAAASSNEITHEKTFDWTIGFGLFKVIHFAELMFLSEVSRKKFLSPLS